MVDEAGWMGWLLVAGQGLLVVLFIAFFYLVIRLWFHLADSGCAYNSAPSPDAMPDGGSEGPSEQKTPSTDKESGI